MKEGSKYIKTLGGQQREIDWIELNNLKKDILWIFAQNTKELFIPFVPGESFQSKYWEYLSLEGDKWFYEEEKKFYRSGTMIILLCMTIEYLDIESGDQQIFGITKLEAVKSCVDTFKSENEDEERLRSILLQHLSIASSMTTEDLRNKDFAYPNREEFNAEINWVDEVFIQQYFRSLLK